MMARKAFGLDDAIREFVRHPSPWMIAATLLAALAARITVGSWGVGDLIVLLAMIALFPFFEWVVHVCVLHWRPKQFGSVHIDPLLARKHREHHVAPRRPDLVFIPWQTLLWVLPVAVAVAVIIGRAEGLTFLTFLACLGLGYESVSIHI